jgi:hypothetical protein
VLFQIISFHIGKNSFFFLFRSNIFFCRNARDHVQPFVLVQFNKLPLHRLVAITCRAWAPGIEHSTKGMRGMVSFQLYRTHTNISIDDNTQD